MADLSGWWQANGQQPESSAQALQQAFLRMARPVILVEAGGRIAVGHGGTATFCPTGSGPESGYPIRAFVPALPPDCLGSAAFRRDHGLTYAYIGGAMANAISSEEMVIALGRAGMLGFFGSAGLPLARVEQAIDTIEARLPDGPAGYNLINSPHQPDWESALVDMYLARGIHTVSASAYIDLSLPLVRYRTAGIHAEADGRVVVPNRVLAKVSRVEVARRFFAPPPEAMLRELVRSGDLSQEQADLAGRVPMAQDLTAEADSGGHTDNRQANSLLPTMLALRDEMQDRYDERWPLRVGAAGGIGTPASASAAFALGADYILTGSVNQSCREAGTSASVREMLAQAGQADVVMAPAADMFEMGVQVQVLKWGTLFAMRARKLYDLYRAYGRIEDIPPAARAQLEKDFFRCSLDEAWESTRQFFLARDASQLEKADRNPKYKLALLFRSYLGQSSDWANSGDESRRADYQIWCGPVMGAFNEWVRGSFLQQVDRREVVSVAMNLLLGAAFATRLSWARAQGVQLPAGVGRFAPLDLPEINSLLELDQS